MKGTKKPTKQKKGFAVMDRALVLRIAKMGGQSLFKKRGKSYLRRLGQKGGTASADAKRELRQEQRLNRIERLALSHA